MCELCKVNTSTIESQYWNVIECRKCHVAMAVLKRHDVKMTHAEAVDLMRLYEIYFKDKMMRTLMQWMPEHLHVHFEDS